MKRLILIIFFIFLTTTTLYAELKGNVFCRRYSIYSNSYENITFPFPTRDLYIYNPISSATVFIDLKSDTNTGDITNAYMLRRNLYGNIELKLYDFITEGITLITTKATGAVSAVEVIAIY